MDYMAKHGLKRVRPTELIVGTRRVISVNLPYWLSNAVTASSVLLNRQQAYIARYALGVIITNVANPLATLGTLVTTSGSGLCRARFYG